MSTPYQGFLKGEVTLRLYNGSGNVRAKFEAKDTSGVVTFEKVVEGNGAGADLVCTADIPIIPNGSVHIYTSGTSSTTTQGVKCFSPKFKCKMQ